MFDGRRIKIFFISENLCQVVFGVDNFLVRLIVGEYFLVNFDNAPTDFFCIVIAAEIFQLLCKILHCVQSNIGQLGKSFNALVYYSFMRLQIFFAQYICFIGTIKLFKRIRQFFANVDRALMFIAKQFDARIQNFLLCNTNFFANLQRFVRQVMSFVSVGQVIHCLQSFFGELTFELCQNLCKQFAVFNFIFVTLNSAQCLDKFLQFFDGFIRFSAVSVERFIKLILNFVDNTLPLNFCLIITFQFFKSIS